MTRPKGGKRTREKSRKGTTTKVKPKRGKTARQRRLRAASLACFPFLVEKTVEDVKTDAK